MSSASPPPGAAPAPAITPPPPSNATAPPPSNSTAPPPSSHPPSSNTTAPPPARPPVAPPPTPVPPPAPPPATPVPPPSPSAPPPASPSPPPASLPPPPASSPPPTPATPSDSPPPSPSIPSASPPPPTSTPPSPATPAIKPPPPPPSSRSPPPPPPLPSSNGISTAAVAGIAVGSTVVVLGLLALIGFLCCRRRRRRDEPYYGGMPPPKDGLQNMQAQNWQYNTPPPVYHGVNAPPQPSPPPPFTSRPPHPPIRVTPPPPPPLPVMSNSDGSSGYSVSEFPLPPPPPGVALGFSKSTFTYEELALATNGFSEANLLGQGGFGYVHKGTLLNGKEVAIKQLKPGSGQGEREFQAEVETISRVNHRHLVSLVGYCISGVQRLLVYEYVPNRTLEFHLHGKDRLPLDWPTRLKIALGSAKGLAYLHEDCNPKIIHRDIKASNILLDFKFEAKVADFGLAKLTTENDTHISTRVMGTFGYLAPEYANSGKLTDKSDVYSFGIVLLELITGRRPVGSSSVNDSLVDWARPLLTQSMEEGDYEVLIDPQLESYNLEEMSHMVACAAACIRHSSRRRPKMSQIVRALVGSVSLDDLNQGITPGNNWVHRSHTSSDYDSTQYKEDMKKFTKVAMASQNYASSEYSAPTSEYGQNVSASSSEGQQTQEMEMSKMKKDDKDAAAPTE